MLIKFLHLLVEKMQVEFYYRNNGLLPKFSTNALRNYFGEILTHHYKVAQYFNFSFVNMDVYTGDNVNISYKTSSAHQRPVNFDDITEGCVF